MPVTRIQGLRASPTFTHSIPSSSFLPNQKGFNTAGSLTLSHLPGFSSKEEEGEKTAPFSRIATMRRGIAAAVALRV